MTCRRSGIGSGRDSLALASIMRVLVLNGGSSSFKFWLGEISGEPIPAAQPAPLWEANVELTAASEIREVLTPVLQRVPGPIDVVGHRIVSGGTEHRESARR